MRHENFPGGEQPKQPKEEMAKEPEVQEEEIPKPELGIEFNQEVLSSLAEQYPDQKDMFERFAELPPITFERGKVNFIFGPNGSGKSTLANAVFLAARVAYETDNYIENPWLASSRDDKEKLTPEEARREATETVLHPSHCSRYEMAEMINMAAAPRLVEDGAMTLTQFQVRKGMGRCDTGGVTDTPVVHRIAVQDMLGEERQAEEEYMFWDKSSPVGSGEMHDSKYVKSGASARQMIEKKLEQQFEDINEGSIVIVDEAAFGLSPKRQEQYIQMMKRFAKEKDLIVIAPENSGYAYVQSTLRIDLEHPKQGLHEPDERQSDKQAGVMAIESQETLGESTVKFAIDHDKLKQLAEEYPNFKSMLEEFAKLPESLSFGPGKTEIFADNGGGKTTMLGAMYFLMEVERRTQDAISWRSDSDERTEDQIRQDIMETLVTDPSNTSEKVFAESLGLASKLVDSGAISLKEVADFTPSAPSRIEGVTAVNWINLLDVAGEVKRDNFRMIKYAKSDDVREVAEEIKKNRPHKTHGSTRQTSEAKLLEILEYMPENGFLFVDEVDGGISPNRQLEMSDRVNQLAKERGITVISTSNSYEGFQYRLTPSLDLSQPDQGIIPPTHKLASTA